MAAGVDSSSWALLAWRLQVVAAVAEVTVATPPGNPRAVRGVAPTPPSRLGRAATGRRARKTQVPEEVMAVQG